MTLIAGDHDLQVSTMEAGTGYGVSYSGRFVQESQFLDFESRLTYAGILFAGSTVAITQGTLSFASTPVDCSTVAGPDREKCRAEVPEHVSFQDVRG